MPAAPLCIAGGKTQVMTNKKNTQAMKTSKDDVKFENDCVTVMEAPEGVFYEHEYENGELIEYYFPKFVALVRRGPYDLAMFPVYVYEDGSMCAEQDELLQTLEVTMLMRYVRGGFSPYRGIREIVEDIIGEFEFRKVYIPKRTYKAASYLKDGMFAALAKEYPYSKAFIGQLEADYEASRREPRGGD